jgi:hypothetical protein
MPAPGSRSFRVWDVLVLVGATALALGWFRDEIFNPYPLNPEIPTIGPWLGRLYPLVLAWSLAVLVLRLQRPRARMVRLARQPGFVACALVAGTMACRAVGLGLRGVTDSLWVIGRPLHWSNLLRVDVEWELFWPNSHPWSERIGLVIAWAWLVQVLSGCFRPEPSWIDRAGRVLGVLWIVKLVLSWIWEPIRPF